LSGYGGLIELVLVFALVLGWGLWELRSVRRYNKARDDKSHDVAGEKSIGGVDH
jgi:hypothetical protein